MYRFPWSRRKSGRCSDSWLLAEVQKGRLGRPTPCSVGTIAVASGIWGPARGVEGGCLPVIVGSVLVLPLVNVGALGKLLDLFRALFLRFKLGEFEVNISELQGGPRSLAAFGSEAAEPRAHSSGPRSRSSSTAQPAAR